VTVLETELRIERSRSTGFAAVSEAECRHAAKIRSDRDAWKAQAERLAIPAPNRLNRTQEFAGGGNCRHLPGRSQREFPSFRSIGLST